MPPHEQPPTPAWPEHVIWWQVYPLGFTGAEQAALPEGSPPRPRLRKVIDWLDHLLGLGANGLALGPVFDSETHGYDTVDHLRIDPRLGTEDDFAALVSACHERGIRVQLDGVFNHIGRGSPQFRDVLERRGESPYADWFRLDLDQDNGRDGFSYHCFEGHDALVSLNHASPAVAEHVAAVMSHWCDRGVDSWRLDAAYAVPAEFWARVLPQVRERHPEVWVSGEMIHGDYAAYVAESGLDSVTQYELWKATWSALLDGNLYELAHALQRHDALLDSFVPQTFVGNHDVTRIASRLGDDRLLPLALASLFALPGVPTVYYGDERGYHGLKEERAGGDDAVRPAYPDSPGELDPLGEPAQRLHQDLIGLRRRHPWLHHARIQEPDLLTNPALAVRLVAGDRVAGLVLNAGDDPVTAALPMDGSATVQSGEATCAAGPGGVSVTVAGRSYAVVI